MRETNLALFNIQETIYALLVS